MSKKSLYFITAVASLALVVTLASNLREKTSNSFLASKASSSLTLDSGTDTGATGEYGNGSFEVSTSAGNTVGWEYKYGKAKDGGLISLGTTAVENPDETNYYIGNTDPITSVTGITINFESDTKLFFFASADGTNYYKLETITESKKVTIGNNYFYFRFVNANCNLSKIDITSIVVDYDCVAADYTDELSDLTSATRINAGMLAESSVTMDSVNYQNGLNSTKSLKITAPISENPDNADNMYMYSFSLALPRAYTIAEIKNMSVTFSFTTDNNTKFNDSHDFVRLYFYFSTSGYSQIKTSASKNVEANTGDLANNVAGWRSATVDFSGASNIADLDEETSISYLYIRPAYVNGSINIDQMRVGFNRTYPEFTIPSEWKRSANLTLTTAANIKDLNASVSSTDVTGTDHGDGVRITANANVAQYTRYVSIYLGHTFNFDLSKSNEATISFWFNFGGATCTNHTKSVNMQLCNGDPVNSSNRTSNEFRTDAASITLDTSDTANGWIKITIRVEKLSLLNNGSFDRINIKTVSSSYLTLNSGEYYEFTSFSYSGLVETPVV